MGLVNCAGIASAVTTVGKDGAHPLAVLRQAPGPGLAVRGTFSPARAWRPAVVARLARTLGRIANTLAGQLATSP